MRERLFRGEREDNGEWIFGMPCATEESGIYAIQTMQGGIFDIIPESISEYTGLTDKNGKKIFEGDIITTKKFGTPDRKYVVTYDEGIATFIGETRVGCVNHFTTFQRDSEEFEVVGNIHDNSELMKGGAE